MLALAAPSQRGLGAALGQRGPSLSSVRSNYCYVHSCLQAVFWCGELTAQPDSCYGRLKAGLLLLKRPVKLQVPSCLSLRSVLAGWDNPRVQHDAGEYFRFLLAQLQLPAFIGQWQARLTLPFTIVDEGQLTTPVILHPESGTLADLVARWHAQYAVHALVHHGGVLLLRIVRYGFRTVAVKKKWNPERLWLFPSLLTLTAQMCGMSPSEWGLSSSMLGIRLIKVITKLPLLSLQLTWSSLGTTGSVMIISPRVEPRTETEPL